MELADFLLRLIADDDMLAAIPASAKEDLNRSMQRRFGRAVLPAPHENMAITIGTPRTCALFFDRVWYPPVWGDAEAGNIGAYGATDVEIWIQLGMLFTYQGLNIMRAGPELLATPLGKLALRGPMERAMADCLRSTKSVNAIPVYRSENSRDQQYAPGATEVLVAALNSVPLAVEKALSWEQVRELRADKNARRKLRRMLHWLDCEMLGKTPEHIACEIDQRVEAYEWALRKHGINTMIGSLSSMLDVKSLVTAAAAFVTVASAGKNVLASIAAASILVTKGALTAATRLVEREDAKRGLGAEIAFVHEVLG